MRASWSFLEQQHIYFHMISYAKVIIESQFQVWLINFVENQQTLISVIEAIAIYHNTGKSQYKSFSASPHTQPSYSFLWLLTLTLYTWAKRFNRTLRKIGAYCVASQCIHLWVMSTIIIHANLHPIGYIYIYISRSFKHEELAKG